LYGAARFGFSEARTIDAGLEEAAERSARATRALIAYELGSGDDRAASLLLAHLPAPEPELEARIARVEEERVAARARLEAFEREVDPRTGIQARAILVLALFSSWLAAPAVTVAAGMTAGFAREIGISVVISVFTVAVFLALRRSLVASRMNRTLLFLLFLAPSMAAVLNLGGWLWGFSSDITGTLEIFLNLTLAVVAMGLVDWRLFPAVLGFAVAYLLAMWHQGGHTLLFLNGADAFAGLVALAIWSPELLRRPLSRGSSPPGSP
ncbi:MAG: hypothetical protein KC656_05255, partial [Myxococcales bacterium]|nr:hypothetical protein [Myxococcales bacterium]